MERKVIIIAGPTCSGKTDLGIEIALRLGGEVLSADSRQVYKSLNVGTAKPSPNQLALVKHHLIDWVDPNNVYNAGQFEEDSISIIENLFLQGKCPIVVGGSGLYIRALISGIFEVSRDEIYRAELTLIKEKDGVEKLYSMLKEKDPRASETMLPQNWKRVVRALEVYKLTGDSILNLQKKHKRAFESEFSGYFIDFARDLLYSRIEQRVDRMIEEGLVQETKSLLERGVSPKSNAMNTVGYKEVIAFLNNEYTLDRAIELIKRNTRRYAKRQFTWFRSEGNLTYIDAKKHETTALQADFVINHFIKN